MWIKNKNIKKYTIRQAQSCDYLEDYFNSKLIPQVDNKGKKLLTKLLECHKRQKKDIENIIGVVNKRKGTSYYFDKMISKHRGILSLLSIQYVSYVRGSKRYYLLMNQLQYKELWEKFFIDANTNADLVLDYLIDKYKIKALPYLFYFSIKEKYIIYKINRYNNKHK